MSGNAKLPLGERVVLAPRKNERGEVEEATALLLEVVVQTEEVHRSGLFGGEPGFAGVVEKGTLARVKFVDTGEEAMVSFGDGL